MKRSKIEASFILMMEHLKSMVRYLKEKYHFSAFLLVVLNSMIKLALTKTFLSRKINFCCCPQAVWRIFVFSYSLGGVDLSELARM